VSEVHAREHHEHLNTDTRETYQLEVCRNIVFVSRRICPLLVRMLSESELAIRNLDLTVVGGRRHA
jgi:hypothetical protein